MLELDETVIACSIREGRRALGCIGAYELVVQPRLAGHGRTQFVGLSN